MGIFTREAEPHPATGRVEIFDQCEASLSQSQNCTKSMDTNNNDANSRDEMMNRGIEPDTELQGLNEHIVVTTQNDITHTLHHPETNTMDGGLKYAIPRSENGYATAMQNGSTEVIGIGIDGDITNAKRNRVGRWTLDEKLLFLFGLQKFGKGRWKKISLYLPNR
jgi:Myb-like DNA-binding domain